MRFQIARAAKRLGIAPEHEAAEQRRPRAGSRSTDRHHIASGSWRSVLAARTWTTCRAVTARTAKLDHACTARRRKPHASPPWILSRLGHAAAGE